MTNSSLYRGLADSTCAGSGLNILVHAREPEALSEQALGSWSSNMTFMCQFHHSLHEVANILAYVRLRNDDHVLPHDQAMQDAQLLPDLPVLLQCGRWVWLVSCPDLYN